ncbi:MAG: hypothetical protein EHM75_12130, partial [Desulfobacteraceae bacterium]
MKPSGKGTSVKERAKVKTGVDEAIGKAGTSVKEGVVSSLKGINEIESEIVTLVRNTVSTTLRAGGSIVTESLSVAK